MRRVLGFLFVIVPLTAFSALADWQAQYTWCADDDIHVQGGNCAGYTTNNQGLVNVVRAINNMPGISWPDSIGGTVGSPLAYLVAGDCLCHGNDTSAVDTLVSILDRLDIPWYAARGNHDVAAVSPFAAEMHDLMLSRYGDTTYAVRVGPLRAVGIDHSEFFEGYSTNFITLRDYLDRLGRFQPVVIFQHYGWDSYGGFWIDDARGQGWANAVSGHNVIAVFVGHDHLSHNYERSGIQIFAASAGGHLIEGDGFLVAEVMGDSLRVGEYRCTVDGSGDWNGGFWKYIYRHKLTIPRPPIGPREWDD